MCILSIIIYVLYIAYIDARNKGLMGQQMRGIVVDTGEQKSWAALENNTMLQQKVHKAVHARPVTFLLRN